MATVLTASEPPPKWRSMHERGVEGDLPDINVWLALAVQEHPHHAQASRYWAQFHAQRSQAAKLWFCRVTMLGLVRLLCQAKVVGAGALGLAQAWGVYQGFRALPSIGLLAENANIDVKLGEIIAAADGLGALPARLWTDAYLAATAQSNALRLVTFDRDFKRLAPEHAWVLPTG